MSHLPKPKLATNLNLYILFCLNQVYFKALKNKPHSLNFQGQPDKKGAGKKSGKEVEYTGSTTQSGTQCFSCVSRPKLSLQDAIQTAGLMC